VGARRPVATSLATVVAILALGTSAAGQEYDPTGGGGYDPAGPGGYNPTGPGYSPGGGTGDAGKVRLKLTAKKKQKSKRAVKVKATCEGRPCTVEAKGKLKAGGDKSKLKPDEESLTAGERDTLKLKLGKAARKTARSAAREDEKLTAKVKATAKGVGGGGSDKAAIKVKLKP
jgi:hypothetical protein